jgi:hypothetical protein
MSHNPGYKPIAQALAESSTWSDRGIDPTPPATLAGQLHDIGHKVGHLEAKLQRATALLSYALANQFGGFEQAIDDEMVAFINENKKK